MTHNVWETWTGVIEGLRSRSLDQLATELDSVLCGVRSSSFLTPVLGAMKSGKSTLINRLLNLKDEEALPKDVLQATAQPVYLVAHSHYYRAIVDSQRDALEAIDPADHARWEALIKGEAPLPADGRLCMGAPDDWYASANVTLVDTPGINSPTEGLFDVTWSTVIECALAIYTMHAARLWQKTDVDFIRSVRRYAGGFVFVITGFDTVGATDWRDGTVTRLAESVKENLREAGIDFLDVCPTSCGVEDPDASGLARLRSVVETVARDQRENILLKVATRRALPRIQEEAAHRHGRLQLREQAALMGADAFRAKAAQFESLMIQEVDKKETREKRIAAEADRIRYGVLTAITNVSKRSAAEIRGSIDALSDTQSAEAFTAGGMRDALESWRVSCLERLNAGLTELTAQGDKSVEELAASLSKSAEELFDAPIALVPPPAGRSEAVVSDDDARDLERERTLIRAQLDELRAHASEAGDLASELRKGIEEAHTTLMNLTYTPVYKKVRVDQGASAVADFFGGVGGFFETVLLLAPIPLGKLAWLRRFAWGTKAVEAVNSLNRLSGKVQRVRRDVRRKGRADGLLENAAQWFSPSRWGRTLGETLGQLFVPDRHTIIEDEDAKSEYLAQAQPLRERSHFLECELAIAKDRRHALQAKIRELELQASYSGDDFAGLRSEERTLSAQIAAQEDEARLLEWKDRMNALVVSLLLDRGADGWLSRMRNLVNEQIDAVAAEARDDFRSRSGETMDDLRSALRALREDYAREHSVVESETAELTDAVAFLRCAGAELERAL